MCTRLKEINERIEAAASRVGRDPSQVTLVAVSKKKSAKMVRSLYECGQSIFGENYIQEAVSKIKELEDIRAKTAWHFIGHLQTNKAKLAAQYFDCIETVDRIKLARSLNRHAQDLGKRLECLVQVNIGNDPSKSGVVPEELEELLLQLPEFSSLSVKGLMCIHPWSSSPQEARRWFRALRELRDDMVTRGLPKGMSLYELSMGMSQDFEVAVEEGATIIRIGTALFGPRV